MVKSDRYSLLSRLKKMVTLAYNTDTWLELPAANSGKRPANESGSHPSLPAWPGNDDNYRVLFAKRSCGGISDLLDPAEKANRLV
jgi:hypothetical protein